MANYQPPEHTGHGPSLPSVRMSDNMGDKPLLSSSGLLTLMEVQHFHSYRSAGCQAAPPQARNRWSRPCCSPRYGCSPYLLPVGLTPMSATQLPGSPVLPVCPPLGIHPRESDSPLYCFVIPRFTALMATSSVSGLPSPLRSSRLHACGMRLWWHLLSGALGERSCPSFSWSHPYLYCLLSLNTTNLPGDEIHCPFLFKSPRNAESALPPLGPLGFF